MGGMLPYGAAIRQAIASNNLEEMRATYEQAKEFLKEQGNLEVALFELQEAIRKSEPK